MDKKLWDYRQALASDLPFIYKTWLNSYCGDSAIGKSVRKSVFHRDYAKVIDRILTDSGVLIACQPDDPKVIYGYLVFEPRLLHYCFVKEAFRFSGIAKSLVVKAVGVQNLHVYTHHTGHLKPILEKYPFLTYNPFVLYKEIEGK